VAVAEEGVAVAGQEQVKVKVKVEVEVTEVAEAEAATKHGTKRGKVKTRRDRRITIESEDMTKK